ncbi:hypothetical protein [Arthrobacter psychrochitiniphilus]|uniref:Trm112 family protein n=1 Tax=Arthrobacter psychrochitiniphilus TaxID=291045 RepID=A0A2V3DWW5_9MICC|nr:hypothetical protein [Arthrobacter psychrochitiniphilus]NYG16515.1 hypothetical protein [Arthrobacter psychrochitiniphilus]PXA69355.1 hypothetical protein CVS29_01980 [Arthrobacter psychrochitiniphilus]
MAKINEGLLALLRCPVTNSPLIQVGEELLSTANGEGGTLVRYKIDEGIALLLTPEQLSPEQLTA